jgi:seryl-tRNA synthetase
MKQLEDLQAQKNSLSKKIGLFKQRSKDTKEIFLEVDKVNKKIESIQLEHDLVIANINNLLLNTPNIPNDDVPIGKDENDNVEIFVNSKLGRGLVYGVLPHYEIAKKLNLIDFKNSVNMSGSRFVSYINDGARLLRVLKNFMLDHNIKNGYNEIAAPVLVKTKAMQNTGQLPKFKDDLFKIENSDYYLIPTGEVPITNFYANQIIDVTKPINHTGYSLCFRSEVGSSGKDVKGIIRMHQFNKVEIVSFCKAEDALKEFDKAIKVVSDLLTLLELPYRKLKLCSGDLGFSSAKTIDFEV